MHSEHFSEAELACHHCGQNNVRQELLNALEEFRTKVGGPVHVNDAYRCPIHNAEVGGAKNSQHVLGLAADISVEGKTARELYQIALQIPSIKGIGVDDHKQYIHVDVRTGDHVAKWCYSETGETIAWYEPPTGLVNA